MSRRTGLVRPMRPEEKAEVHRIFRHSFPRLMRLIFAWTPDVLVCEKEGRLLGAVLFKVYPLPEGRRGGLISWLFTDEAARGHGVAGSLLDAALESLDRRGCYEVTACVEGDNTDSSRLFASRGFRVVSPAEQLRRYGTASPKVWWHTQHFADLGHFLWARPAATRSGSPTQQWLVGVGLNATLASLSSWWALGWGALRPEAWVPLAAAVLALLGARQLGIRLVAWARGVPTRFRAWETGFTISGVVALFGGFFPVAGNEYPADPAWRYRDYASHLGAMGLGGAVAILALAWGSWAMLALGAVPEALAPWARATLRLATLLAVVDILIPFFPFLGSNGRRLWRWSGWAWAAVALPAAALFLV